MLTSADEHFLKTAVAAVPRVAEIIASFPPTQRQGAVDLAEDRYRRVAQDFGCTEQAAKTWTNLLTRNLQKQVEERLSIGASGTGKHRNAADEEEYQDSEVSPYAAEGYYEDNEVPHARRRSLTFVMAMFGLALVGTAGAFGYRQISGGSPLPMPPSLINAGSEPNKIAVASREPQSKNSRNESQLAIAGSIENLVSRDERSATVEAPKSAAGVTSAPIQTRQDSALPAGAPTAPPATDQAVSKKTTRLAVAAAASSSGPAANSTAEVTPPALGGYAVQVTSERSESAAQAAFRRLQVKYPKQLSGRHPVIRRADLGATGIYYRALVGHFASAEKAARWCSNLKATGGDCIIQKN